MRDDDHDRDPDRWGQMRAGRMAELTPEERVTAVHVVAAWEPES